MAGKSKIKLADLSDWLKENRLAAEDYFRGWTQRVCGEPQVDRATLDLAIDGAYAMLKLAPPIKIWCQSVWQMQAIASAWAARADLSLIREIAETEGAVDVRLWQTLLQTIDGVEERLQAADTTVPDHIINPFDLEMLLQSSIERLVRAGSKTRSRDSEPATRAFRSWHAAHGRAFNRSIWDDPRLNSNAGAITFGGSERNNRVLESIANAPVLGQPSGNMDTIARAAQATVRHNMEWFQNMERQKARPGAKQRLSSARMSQSTNVFIDEAQQLHPSKAQQSVIRNLLSLLRFWFMPDLISDLSPYFLITDLCGEPPFDPDTMEKLLIFRTLGKGAFAYSFRPGVALICAPPLMLHRDERGRIHSKDGASSQFTDGFCTYTLRGVMVARRLIEAPDSILLNEIEHLENLEVRRVLMEQYGLERYMIDSGAAIVEENKWGTLYHKPALRGDAIAMLVVDNATAEPDGTRRRYCLFVPPDIRTAREAVAWTFGMQAADYDPIVET